MDGLKRRLNESIQLKLSASLLLAIVLVAIVAGIFSFVSAFDEAHELQDDTLRQIAGLFMNQGLAGFQGSTNAGDEESRVIVQPLGAGSKSAAGGNAGTSLPLADTLKDGLQTVDVGDEPYRVLIKTTASGERFAVAQETAVRDDIARDSALRTLLPLLILVPVLLLIVADLVRKMFRPIAVLSAEIDARGDQELHPVVQAHLPIEIRPFVVAINRLLGRVDRAMQSQRRFVADAAHELRSPLTAMSLQAERLAEAEMSEPGQQRLLALRQGIARGRKLLEQLLSLAKAQATTERLKSSVSVLRTYSLVLEDLLPQAEAKQIDIGVEGENDADVWINELDLQTLVKNLVDNAIRYTPKGGRVDLSVSVEQGRAVLQVRDSGLGIPIAERERIFDPFYRSLGTEQSGSGLGLSIVKAIADGIGAEIRLDFADDLSGSGLCVTVLMPIQVNVTARR